MANLTASEWNEKHPIGTAVSYVPNSRGETLETKTTSKAWQMGTGNALIMVTGCARAVSLLKVFPR